MSSLPRVAVPSDVSVVSPKVMVPVATTGTLATPTSVVFPSVIEASAVTVPAETSSGAATGSGEKKPNTRQPVGLTK